LQIQSLVQTLRCGGDAFGQFLLVQAADRMFDDDDTRCDFAGLGLSLYQRQKCISYND
jgi:hypothetical protein